MKVSRPAAVIVGLAFAVAAVVSFSPAEVRITSVVTSAPLVGNGSSGSPIDLDIETDSSITGTGSAGAKLSATAALVLDGGFFGDGSDGNGTVSGSTTLTRDMQYNNLTIGASGVLTPAGYRIFVRGTLTLTSGGVIVANGTNGTAGADSNLTISTCSSCGAAGTGAAAGTLPGGTGGGNGCNISNPAGGASATHPMYTNADPNRYPTQCQNCNGGDGFIGGGFGRGGAGGASGSCIANNNVLAGSGGTQALVNSFESRWHDLAVFSSGKGVAKLTVSGFGTGGGQGACGNDTSTRMPARPGTGGGGAGVIFIAAKQIVGGGQIQAIGGNGGAGGNGVGGLQRPGAGGGGGGGGGMIGIATGDGWVPTALVTGGSGGNGGTSDCSGVKGQGGRGGNGSDGKLITWKVGA